MIVVNQDARVDYKEGNDTSPLCLPLEQEDHVSPPSVVRITRKKTSCPYAFVPGNEGLHSIPTESFG